MVDAVNFQIILGAGDVRARISLSALTLFRKFNVAYFQKHENELVLQCVFLASLNVPATTLGQVVALAERYNKELNFNLIVEFVHSRPVKELYHVATVARETQFLELDSCVKERVQEYLNPVEKFMYLTLVDSEDRK